MSQYAYLYPTEDIVKIGRSLKSGNFKFLSSQLKEGEKLVGIYQKGDLASASWLYDEEQMLEIESFLINDYVKKLGYYALTDDDFYQTVCVD